jgi:hypothetical protein
MLRIKPVFRRIKCLGRIALGREAFYRREIFRDYRALGHHGAQFAVIPELLNRESAVDSFGIGTDISFELELIRASADGGGGGAAQTAMAPVRHIATIMKELGHGSIDLLKMDIEGAEYGVIEDLSSSQIPIGQICVEFHHRWKEIGPSKTRRAIDCLRPQVAGSFRPPILRNIAS